MSCINIKDVPHQELTHQFRKPAQVKIKKVGFIYTRDNYSPDLEPPRQQKISTINLQLENPRDAQQEVLTPVLNEELQSIVNKTTKTKKLSREQPDYNLNLDYQKILSNHNSFIPTPNHSSKQSTLMEFNKEPRIEYPDLTNQLKSQVFTQLESQTDTIPSMANLPSMPSTPSINSSVRQSIIIKIKN